jgi:enoyl-CoA hydratase/carnithine racemase
VPAAEQAAASEVRAVLLRAEGDAFSAGADVSIFAGLDQDGATGTQIGRLAAVIGAFPFAGGTQRLASRIGAARTAQMVYGASIHPAEELAGWGLVSHVTAPERLLEEGRAFARQLAAAPTLAHRATKHVLRAGRTGGVPAADQVTHAEGPAVILSRDLQDGIASLQRSGPGRATFANR